MIVIAPENDMRPVLARLRERMGAGGRVMVVSAVRGEGVSSLAASLALYAGEGSRKPVWLLDLDVSRNLAFDRFSSGALSRRFGPMGPPYSAALRSAPPFEVVPEADALPAGAFTAHRIGESRVMVTRLDLGMLPTGARVRIVPRPAYWEAVKASTDWTFVDAPSLEASMDALTVAPDMDACLLVVQADRTSADTVRAAAARVREAGGRLAGVLLNRRQTDAAFCDRMLGFR